MDKILEILAANHLTTMFKIHFAYNQWATQLEIQRLYFHGLGDSPEDAIKALLANIREVWPALLES